MVMMLREGFTMVNTSVIKLFRNRNVCTSQYVLPCEQNTRSKGVLNFFYPFVSSVLRREMYREMRTAIAFLTIAVLMVSIPTTYGVQLLEQNSTNEFLSSFLKHYEFGLEGRYVHEYHPFVLKKTRESFLVLENALCQNKLKLDGRMMILGYEEQGAPTYYTDFMQPKIDDEAMVKSKSGWSQKLHNRFGFMTGFLLKDVNRIAQMYNLGDRQIFEHINPNEQLLFNDRAKVFQEHAFGEARPLIMKTKEQMNKLIAGGASKAALKGLIPFWNTLYSGALKVGNSQIAGTQDILFSIEYGRYVLDSKANLRRCFVGPDITYPIEIFAKQQKGVTRNSQAFVKTFVPNLKPIENESTVYIFCSFVDGVGKSTMLGNIKNWMKHGADVNQYGHVDNSSSQLAELFQFKDKVFIADLPAQISHSTYKPDGLVYVDVRTELSAQQYAALDTYVVAHKEELTDRYYAELQKVRALMHENGPHAPTQLKNSQYHFLRNLILLKKDQDNTWAPCLVNGQEYLFNMKDDGEYRMLLPVGKAKSEGLKNVEADQMLFVDGVRLPLPYDYFVNNLVTRLQEAGVKRVVFVDFLSMYPRSSRENIRVNYLLQQLALLDTDFDVKQSTYRNFTSGGELLHCLLQPNIYDRMARGLELEALVRWQLFSMIQHRKEGDLSGYSEQMLTNKLRQDVGTVLSSGAKAIFKKDLNTKLIFEKKQLNETYCNAKSFINLQCFSMHDAYNFYRALQFFMSENVESSLLERIWKDVGSLLLTPDLKRCEQGLCDNLEIETSTRKKVRVMYKIHETCRSENMLTPFLRMMRSSWMTTIFCFFGGHVSGSASGKIFSIENPAFPHIPIHLLPGEEGYWYLVQEVFESFHHDEIPTNMKILNRLYGVSSQLKPDLFMVRNTPCVGATPHVQTNTGIFDFDCSLVSQKTNYPESAMTKLVRKLQKDTSVNVVTPLIEAWHDLVRSSAWRTEHNAIMAKSNMRVEATPEQPFGLYSLLLPPKDESTGTSIARQSAYAASLPINRSIKTIMWGMPWQEDIIRYALRMWFTLDMIIKDPESELVVRSGNREDIAAAVTLLEVFIMPKYFGLRFEYNLFPDYTQVELFPSNDFWPHLLDQDE